MGQKIKIIVSFEKRYRSYQEVIAAAIRILRLCAEVATSDLDTLAEIFARFSLHLVICSHPKPAGTGGVAAWVELSLGPTGPARICIGGDYSEEPNPTLETLLAIIDEVKRLTLSGEGFRRC